MLNNPYIITIFSQCTETSVCLLLQTAPWANKPATVFRIVLLLVCLFAELRVAVKIRKYALEKCLCSCLAAVAHENQAPGSWSCSHSRSPLPEAAA